MGNSQLCQGNLATLEEKEAENGLKLNPKVEEADFEEALKLKDLRFKFEDAKELSDSPKEFTNGVINSGKVFSDLFKKQKSINPNNYTDQSVKVGTSNSTNSHVNTLLKITEQGIPLIELEPTDSMNKLSPIVESRLNKLERISPESLAEIREEYDPKVESQGPFVHSILGLTYQGQVSNKMPHGWGKIITKRGEYVEGFFNRGQLDKFVRYILFDKSYYEGGIFNKMKHGKGTYCDSKGIVTTCEWVEGCAKGETVIRDATGDLLFQGNILNSKRTGNCFSYDKIHKFKYKGKFKDDKFHGIGRKDYDNGIVYCGSFSRGKENGEGNITYRDGRIFKGIFEDGEPVGNGILITNDGEEKKVFAEKGTLRLVARAQSLFQ